MPRTASEISQAIRAKLRVLDPDISAEPITPERKIIDSVAEVIADAEVDKYILDYQFDIDTKVGADLDKFVAIFGFARQGGRRATGRVTFSRSTPATTDIIIPAGTQVVKPATIVSQAVIFQTTVTATIYTGTSVVEVPIECTINGEIGNVVANSIVSIGSVGADISSVFNENSTSGGSSDETDGELRVRFKNTIFRNISGTSDQYLALAIASRFTNKANIIGPQSRFIEYIQIANDSPSGGLTGAISQIPYSKYTYDFDYYVTNNSLTDETFFIPRGVDYNFNASVPPSISVVNTSSLPVNTVVLFEHTYCSANSRNDPVNNIMNYVDVYVSGVDATTAIEACRFPTSAFNFTSTPTSAYYTGKFKRADTNSSPAVGNRFQELLWQPVTALPEQIIIGGTTFNNGSDFWLVTDTSAYGGSRRGRNGIEWAAAATTGIADTTPFSLTYTFNKLILTLNELMESHKQITTDVLVHQAKSRYLIVNLVIMYETGFATASVDTAIATALTDFFERKPFGSVIQISDITEIVHRVPGVDNVRLTVSSDGVAYGIQEVAADGSTLIGSPQTTDFALQDSDLPILQSVGITRRSQNTWN